MFWVLREEPWEEPFPFKDDKTTSSNNPRDRLPNVLWDTINKKFVVIQAPVEAGKMHQLNTLATIQTNNDESMVCISYRIALVQQIAKRLDIACYENLTPNQLDEMPWLSIVLNSLPKLKCEKQFDLVVLDEVAFTRRHFVSKT